MAGLAPALVALALGACSSAGTVAGADGGADAPAPVDAGADASTGCLSPEGVTHVMSTVELLPSGEGDDLNGDGQPDNAVGALAPFRNSGLADSVASGEMLILSVVGDWAQPPTPDDPAVNMVVFYGLDADVPPDPANNFDGLGRFLVPTQQFDIECTPTNRWDQAAVVERVLTGTTSSFTWVEPDYGTIEFRDARVTLTFAADYSTVEGRFTGVWTICGLSRSLLPGSTEMSVLDGLASPALFGLGPDIDRDDDGLEQLVYEGQSLVRCIDGDGTVIDGGDCVCDPGIADGYSVALRTYGVTASIVGVAAQ